MLKPNKQVQIDFIIDRLKLGYDRGKILSKFVKKWHMSDRSFDRLLKQAKTEYSVLQRRLKKVKNDLDLQDGIEQHKKLIADANERKEILTKILRGQIPLNKPMVVDGLIQTVEVVPDWMDRKNAIAELNKMEGDYAETALRIKGDKENPLFTPAGQLTDDQFQQLLKSAREFKTSRGK
ncbi:MAG: hypothetical protein JWO92_2533 [Chitinophagaceae bacterium]|nr:hypothetical protein [Chitinophagaceae bacterium]